MSEIYILTGNLGCGKSEIAINLCENFSSCNNKVALIDADIVNPYFCTREYNNCNKNITIFAPNKYLSNAELMILTSEQMNCLNDTFYDYIVVDLGGDLDGLKALVQMKRFLIKREYKMIFVLNTSRPKNCNMDKAMECMKEMEYYVGLKFTDIICNTHFEDETDICHILYGDKIASNISKVLKINYLYLCCTEKLKEIVNLKCDKKPLTINRFLKLPWNQL